MLADRSPDPDTAGTAFAGSDRHRVVMVLLIAALVVISVVVPMFGSEPAEIGMQPSATPALIEHAPVDLSRPFAATPALHQADEARKLLWPGNEAETWWLTTRIAQGYRHPAADRKRLLMHGSRAAACYPVRPETRSTTTRGISRSVCC